MKYTTRISDPRMAHPPSISITLPGPIFSAFLVNRGLLLKRTVAFQLLVAALTAVAPTGGSPVKGMYRMFQTNLSFILEVKQNSYS